MTALFNKLNRKKYGEEYPEHLFRQYQLVVQSTDKISDRRNNANNFYLGINTALLSLLGLSSQIADLFWIRPMIFILGLIFSVIFWFLINSYKQLNSGKFKVIHEIEKKLPLALFAYEWEILGNGKDKKKYLPFSHIELWIPIILGIVYLLILFPYLRNLLTSSCSLILFT